VKILQVTCSGGMAGIPTVIKSYKACFESLGHSCDVVSLDKNEKGWKSPPGVLSSYRLSHSSWSGFLYSSWAKGFLKQGGYDAVLVQYSPLDRALVPAAKALGIKTAYFYQNVTDPNLYEGAARETRIKEDRQLLSGLKKADLCFVASEFSAKKVLEKTSRQATVIPLGVDIEFWTPGEEKKEPYHLVSLGKVYAHKGIKELMTVFSTVKKKFPDATLDVIGKIEDDDYARSCKAAAVEGVEFLGLLSNEEILARFRRASLFVSATLFEGFGLPFIEAAATGLPSLAFDLCSLPEVIKDGETGVLLPPKDLEKFAEEIIALLQDDDRRKKLAQACRPWAEEFTWMKSSKLLLKEFE